MKLKPKTALATDTAAGSPAELKFAETIGAAVEEFTKGGGTLVQAGYSLLRYAAQAHIFQGHNVKRYQGLALRAFTEESKNFRAQAKKGQA